MRILHVYKTYYPDNKGGVEEVIRQLGCFGLKHGFSSEIFTFSTQPQKPFEFEAVPVHHMKLNFELSSTPFSLKGILKFRSIAQDFDIIHYHYPFPFGDILKLTSGLNKPSLVTYHSDIIKQKYLKYIYFPLEQWFLRDVDKIVCTSSNYLKTSKNLQRFKEKTSVIPLGLNRISSSGQLHPKTDEFLSHFNKPFFLFIGSLRNYKGIHHLLEAARSVKEHFVVIGGGKNFSFWKKYVEDQKLTNVHMLGFLDDVDKFAILKKCICLVLPSSHRSEAFGMVLLEASICSKPMISTELGTGTSFVNLNHETGLVIEAGNTEQLVDACHFIKNNPKLASKMGKNARQRYEITFTAEKMCASYAEIYRQLLDES